MTIGFIGLGLIGGSLAKALNKNTEHEVLGYDINTSVILKAKTVGAIRETLREEDIPCCDMLLLALYPQAAVDFIIQHAAYIKKGAIVIDCCGVKRVVCDALRPIAKEHGFTFIGGHPMAGKQFSGFWYSSESLFENASMIFTPDQDIDIQTLYTVRNLFRSLGFTNIEITSPDNHDNLIAYTSQLAHVVSNAYVKSPSALKHAGFSAGSYRDLTRVAWLNEKMWTELFFDNADHLSQEIDHIIEELKKYSAALKEGDREEMIRLLRDGKERKEQIDGKEDLE